MTRFTDLLALANNALTAGRYHFSIDYCEQALTIQPQAPDALTLLAGALTKAGHHARAYQIFSTVATLMPNNPHATLNAALSAQTVGAIDEAVSLLEKLIDTTPDFAPAYFAYSTIKKFDCNDADWVQKFETLLNRSEGNKNAKEMLFFSLGKIHDDLQEYDRSFSFYKLGNKIAARTYNHHEEAKYLDRVRTTVEQLQKAGPGDLSRKPAFIVGMPRSGSTLIESRLSTSPDVKGLGERHDIYALSRKTETKSMTSPALLGREYLNIIEPLAPGALRTIDKNLFNHELLGFIKTILPNAKIINSKRNIVDTCLACYFQRFGAGMDFSYDLENLAAKYRLYTDIMDYWSDQMEILTIDYEDHIASPNDTIGTLFSFIGMENPTTPEKPALHTTTTASAWQVRQPLYKTSVQRWKNYKEHLGPLFNAFEKYGVAYDGVG